MMRLNPLALALVASFAALIPSEAYAQPAVFASFRAEYAFTSPLAVGPHRVKFTLYDDGTFTNDDGNGGEWVLAGAGDSVSMWFINEAAAISPYPPVGAPTWTGTVTAGNVCNGQIRRVVYGAPPELGTWKTKGCP